MKRPENLNPFSVQQRPDVAEIRDMSEYLLRLVIELQDLAKCIERGKHYNDDYWQKVEGAQHDLKHAAKSFSAEGEEP